MPNQKIVNQLLICVSLYQHAKNKAASSICSGEILDLKILQSDWLRAFWPISQQQDFPKYRICLGTLQIIKFFYYITNSVKINDQIVFKFKKPCFWLISPILWAKRVFPKN